jgi:hypothetical protein
MNALITESTNYSADLMRALMPCPHDSLLCSAYDKRGMRALLTKNVRYYSELIRETMTCTRDA